MIISVPLPHNRQYPIYLNEGEQFVSVLEEQAPASRYVCFTNTTLAEIYKEQIEQWKSLLPGFLLVTIDDGEQYKNMHTILTVIDTLLENKCDRKTVIIAFGGGVIGDMAGFTASLVLRGIDFVQVPTTLLAMVDSSVGGKTGVNHKEGKNLIGAFYQPKFVWIDTTYLETLPEREYLAGCGEVAKYGYIGGIEMFHFIKGHFEALLNQDLIVLEKAIQYSVEIKASVVADDEREQGNRALLNYGHTFGHALEKFYKYSGILHGEGVIWGIYCALELSVVGGLLSTEDEQELRTSLESLPLPTLPTPPDIDALYQAMGSDKKSIAGSIYFVVPSGVGTSIVTNQFSQEQVLNVMKKVFA